MENDGNEALTKFAATKEGDLTHSAKDQLCTSNDIASSQPYTDHEPCQGQQVPFETKLVQESTLDIKLSCGSTNQRPNPDVTVLSDSPKMQIIEGHVTHEPLQHVKDEVLVLSTGITSDPNAGNERINFASMDKIEGHSTCITSVRKPVNMSSSAESLLKSYSAVVFTQVSSQEQLSTCNDNLSKEDNLISSSLNPALSVAENIFTNHPGIEKSPPIAKTGIQANEIETTQSSTPHCLGEQNKELEGDKIQSTSTFESEPKLSCSSPTTTSVDHEPSIDLSEEHMHDYEEHIESVEVRSHPNCQYSKKQIIVADEHVQISSSNDKCKVTFEDEIVLPENLVQKNDACDSEHLISQTQDHSFKPIHIVEENNTEDNSPSEVTTATSPSVVCNVLVPHCSEDIIQDLISVDFQTETFSAIRSTDEIVSNVRMQGKDQPTRITNYESDSLSIIEQEEKSYVSLPATYSTKLHEDESVSDIKLDLLERVQQTLEKDDDIQRQQSSASNIMSDEKLPQLEVLELSMCQYDNVMSKTQSPSVNREEIVETAAARKLMPESHVYSHFKASKPNPSKKRSASTSTDPMISNRSRHHSLSTPFKGMATKTTTRNRSVSITLPPFSKGTCQDLSRPTKIYKTTTVGKPERELIPRTLSHSEDVVLARTMEMKLNSFVKRMKLDECNPGTTLIHLASMKGNLEAVKVLILDFGFDPNVHDENYQATPLHHAAQNGHIDILDYLVNVRRCNPELKDMNGLMPLHYATRKGHLRAVKCLCNDHKCDPEAKDNEQQTALHYACRFGYKDIVEFLDETKGCNLEIMDRKLRTPLHFACEFRHCEIVYYLVHKRMCNTNVQDVLGRTPLHYTCIWWKRIKYDDDKNLSCKIVKELLRNPSKCDVNIATKDGDTALHLACKTDRVDIVNHLLTKPGCNPNKRNKLGQTPLQLTSHLKVIGELISKGANPMINVLYKWKKICDETTSCICLKSWSPEQIRELTHAGMKPMELFTWLIEDISEQQALEAIQSIIENTSWNFNTCFRNGCNALHLACKANRAIIVECLLEKGKCNPNIKSNSGHTPLQLSTDISVVKCLLQNQAHPTEYLRSLMFQKQECDLLNIIKNITEDATWQIEIALLLACEANKPNVVQFLLAERKCNPNAVNNSKRNPLQSTSTSNPDIIKLLLQYGANPVHVYKFHSKILGTKQPLCPSVKVFIVGDPTVGKSCLTAGLQNEPFIEMLSRPKKVSGVSEKTAGVIPYEFHSKMYGRITLYDFAGQREYYGSHAALLCNAIQSSPPIFLLVVKLNEDNHSIKENIIYWTTFIDNQCTSVDRKPHLIVIGSYADKLLERKEDPEEKRLIVEDALKEHLSNLKFVEFIAMNCSYANTPEMRKLCSVMKESILAVRSQSISFSAHCFQVYLIDKFRDEVAVRLKDIKKQVESDCGEQHDYTNFTSFIPTNIQDLSAFCKELSDQGHNLFLNNPSKPEDGWIIIDKSSLLNEVTGSIFAPASFKEHVDLASSTGVVPFVKIKDHFPTHDPEMIVGYLSHLEFCHELSDKYVLRLLDKDKEGVESERHFFFSSLVTLKIPKDIWKPKPQQFSYHCGWILQCKKEEGFFTSRFIEVLLLRLAFSFALARSPDEVDDAFPAIQRECFVWKNGIFWGSKYGPEMLVEICINKAVVVLMRCEGIHLIECIKYRPKIMIAVQQCAKTFCPKVQTQEFFLDPSEIAEYPLVEKSLIELNRYSIEKIAHTSIVFDEKASVVTPTASLSLKHLLQLEPYAILKESMLQKVLEECSDKISNCFLNEITECGCENTLFIKMFDCRQRIQNSKENLHRALVKWRDECGGTYKHLKQRLSQFSIFAGRETSIHEMANVHESKTLLHTRNAQSVSSTDDDLTSPLDNGTPYAVNLDLNFLDDYFTDLDESDANESYRSFEEDGKPCMEDLQLLQCQERTLRIISTVAEHWEELAIALGFDQSVIGYVRKDYDHDSKGATYRILQMWLENDLEYNDLKEPITWFTLLECLIDIGYSTISDEVFQLLNKPAIMEAVDL